MAQKQKKHLRFQVIDNEKTGRTSTSSLNPNVSSKGPHLHHTLASGKCCIPENQVWNLEQGCAQYKKHKNGNQTHSPITHWPKVEWNTALATEFPSLNDSFTLVM